MPTISKFAAVLLIALPIFVSAQTVEELQAQAQALLLKVQQLQQQLGSGGTYQFQQYSNPFPPSISQFRLGYQAKLPGPGIYTGLSGNELYEYVISGETVANWTKLVTVKIFSESSSADAKKVYDALGDSLSAFDSSRTVIVNRTYQASSLIGAQSDIYVVLFYMPVPGTNIVEFNLQKYYVKNGKVYEDIYAERRNQSEVNAVQTEWTAAMDRFVATIFPDPNAVPVTSNVPSGSAPYIDSSACPLIGRILSLGSTGDDVTRLQQFLARDASVYPERLVTGYYGALTEAAVRRWQVKFNIVSSGNPQTTGYGQVGPRTAAAMSLQCSTSGGGGGAAPAVGGFIRVTPIAGNAPLSVSVEATVNTVNSCAGVTYTIEYGDNTAPSQIIVPAGRCTQLVQTLGHTYQYGNTYQLTLAAGAHRTFATVTVYGAGPTTPTPGTIADSVSANPTTGQAPLTVTFTGFINGSRSCGSGTYTADFGDGQTLTIPYPDGCQAQSLSVTHQYTAGGTFNARLFRGSQTTGTPAAAVSITVTGAPVNLGPFVVTPGINNNPLSVEVEFDIATPCSMYDVNWGDGTAHVTQSQGSNCAQVVTTKTFGHTYSGTGSYTITVTRGTRTDTAAITIASF